jgi:phospho-N-acetylmuramoyl-pentapeptide-transferase
LAGTSAISVLALDFTFLSGNIIFSNYLNIMYIQFGRNDSFIAAFVGALIGFLWYNSYPASVFMGHGKFTIGGIIAVLIAVRKELLIPLLWSFLVENISGITSQLFQIH